MEQAAQAQTQLEQEKIEEEEQEKIEEEEDILAGLRLAEDSKTKKVINQEYIEKKENFMTLRKIRQMRKNKTKRGGSFNKNRTKKNHKKKKRTICKKRITKRKKRTTRRK